MFITELKTNVFCLFTLRSFFDKNLKDVPMFCFIFIITFLDNSFIELNNAVKLVKKSKHQNVQKINSKNG